MENKARSIHTTAQVNTLNIIDGGIAILHSLLQLGAYSSQMSLYNDRLLTGVCKILQRCVCVCGCASSMLAVRTIGNW